MIYRLLYMLSLSILLPKLILAQDASKIGTIEKTRILNTAQQYCELLTKHGKGDDNATIALYDLFSTPSQLVYDDIDLYPKEENIDVSRYLTRIKRNYSGKINFACANELKSTPLYIMEFEGETVALITLTKTALGSGFNKRIDNVLIIHPKTGKIINIMKEMHTTAKPLDINSSTSRTEETLKNEEVPSSKPKVDAGPISMVFVKGGNFRMGNDLGQPDESPIHVVKMSDFYIGVYEITQKQWKEIMGADNNPSIYKGCDDCPVETVDWNQAQEFIKKLNKKTGLQYRLPTEAEWEYAAKGGVKTQAFKFCGGDAMYEVGWYKDNSMNRTHPVGQKKPNELGIFDMSGNVSEWCEDWYAPYTIEKQEDPIGPLETELFGNDKRKVIRGGAFRFSENISTVSDRQNAAPNLDKNYLPMAGVGFRLAMNAVLPEPEEDEE
jgi:formylglycine-generating enzyme required for sulfatase activity